MIENNKTNGFAIASFIFGLVGGLIGVVFGIVALVQIKRRGGRGKGLAITGLILSSLSLALIGTGAVLAFTGGADRATNGSITKAGRVRLADMRPGDCLNGVRDTTPKLSWPAVPCSEQHEGEVIAIVFPTDGPWVESALDEQVWGLCSERLLDLTTDISAIDVAHILPPEDDWNKGERAVPCIALDAPGPTTGSLRG